MIKQAVILAGGMGTRLGSLTSTMPKPLLSVGGRPFLAHLIQEISRFAVEEILILGGRFGQQIVNQFDGKTENGAKISVIAEPEPRGTAGALKFAEPRIRNEFLLCNGDSWVDIDITRFQQHWRMQRADPNLPPVQLAAKRVSDAGRYGTLAIADGLVTEFRDKAPASSGRPGQINAGVYLIDKSIIELIPEGRYSLENDLLPGLAARRSISAWAAPDDAYFIDIGVPESYDAANRELLQRRQKPAVFFDRDGTLNEDLGYTYRVQDLKWRKGAREAIRVCNDLGYYVFVVSNQSGVGRGYYDDGAVIAFHRGMQQELARIGAHIDALKYCPHSPAGDPRCLCRKPAPGLLLQLLNEWPIDRERSFMIGDKDADVDAAEAAEIVGVKSGQEDLSQLVADLLAKHSTSISDSSNE